MREGLLKGLIKISCLALIVYLLFLLSSFNYVLYHSVVEVFSIIIACSVFIIAWNSRDYSSNDYLLFIGVSFLFVALIDFLHLLSFGNVSVFVNEGTSYELWIAARYIQCVSFLIAPFFIKVRMHLKRILTIYCLVIFLFILSISLSLFPACYVNGEFSVFARYSEAVTSVIFGASIYLLYRKRDRFSRRVFLMLLLAIAFLTVSEFTVIIKESSNVIGHLFKVLSFFFIYKAIVETGLRDPYSFLFTNLKKATEDSKLKAEILDATNDAVILNDLKGNFIYLNASTGKSLGYEHNELMRKTIFELIPKSEINIFKHELNNLSKKAADSFESFMVRKDGSLMPIEVHCQFIKLRGEKAMLSVVIDITERRELDELKSNVTALTTHDLKQPLTPIIGYADLLKDRVTNPVLRGYLDKITFNAFQMRDIINRLLNLFKLDSNNLRFNFANESIDSIINEVLIDFASSIKLKNIRLVKHFGKVNAKVDRLRMRDLFTNLLDNAIKFSSLGGLIEVRTWVNGKSVYASIKDYGVGIRKEDLPKLFAKFYQTAEGKHAGGTGIGLLMVKKIIDMHNGSIKVNSEYGSGSEFIVCLPSRH